MKYIILLYIISTLAYFLIGDGSMLWALINMFNLLAFIVVLLLNKITKSIYTQFAIYLTISRILYTSICAISDTNWIYAMNKVFAVICTIWLIITIMIEKMPLNGGQK